MALSLPRPTGRKCKPTLAGPTPLPGCQGAPCAFKAALVVQRRPGDSIERVTRRAVAERLRRDGVIPAMISRIKELFPPPGAAEG